MSETSAIPQISDEQLEAGVIGVVVAAVLGILLFASNRLGRRRGRKIARNGGTLKIRL